MYATKEVLWKLYMGTSRHELTSVSLNLVVDYENKVI